MPAMDSQIVAEVLTGFDDPALVPRVWTALLERGPTNAVNLTWHWQRCWWEAFGHGQLLLIAARRRCEIVAVAPLFADSGMVFNICPEDHLDFVGDVSDPAVLDAILTTARNCVDGFLGFRFYFIPDRSTTRPRLEQAARRLGLLIHREATLASPWVDLKACRAGAEECTRKASLLRHERFFFREGGMQVDHWCEAGDVAPCLDDFFEQHVARRAATPHPSLFCEQRQRAYYRHLTREAASQGWLRFTRLSWRGQAIAYHFGLSYQGRYLWGIPSFDIRLSRHSPGEVLLRQVLLQAIAEGATQFDFGPGDEAYKHRFANSVTHLETWGLYPASEVCTELASGIEAT
jgi:CelD/BcsL family acetyltransferase involved in cellulose biosynthesis